MKTQKNIFNKSFGKLLQSDKLVSSVININTKNNYSNMFNIYTKKINSDIYSHNLFKPHYNPDTVSELSAAQKFGGQNLKGLKRLGQGRDRVVYALDKDKVLKVAKNPGGLTQNTAERDLQYLGMGEQLEYGKDYVVMKRQEPLSKAGKQKLTKVRKVVNEHTNPMSPSYRADVSMSLSGDDSVLDEVGIGKDILDFQPNPQEIFADRQWGEDSEGNIVLLDGGALQDDNSLSKYRVKDFDSDDWQYQDWQDIQKQRAKYAFKGNYDETHEPRNKLYRQQKHEYHKTLEPMFPFEDEQSKNRKWTNMYNVGSGTPNRFKLKFINPFDVEFTEDTDTKNRENIEKIKQSGEIKHPIDVWNKYDSDDYYELVDGHHRTIAAQERGDEKILAYVFDNIDSRNKYRKDNNLDILNNEDNNNMYPLVDNESKNDKVLFPKKLEEEHNIHFKDAVISPRHKRILIKQLRRNPELLEKKQSDRPLILETASKDYIKGYAQVSVPTSNIYQDPYVMSIAYPTLNKQYDPEFDTFLEQNPHLLRERETLKYPKSKHNISRTLGHEFEHINQIEKKGVESFKDSYYLFSEDYEKEADKEGFNISNKEKPKERYDALQLLDEIQEDDQSKNKLNPLLKSKVRTDNIYYTRPIFKGLPAKKLVSHDKVKNKGNIIENTIQKYPNLIPKLNTFDGNILINETSQDCYGEYDANENEIRLPYKWQRLPKRERAEILFHELRHREQSKEYDEKNPIFAPEYTDNEGNMKPIFLKNHFSIDYQNETFDKGYKKNKYEKDARLAGAEGLVEVDYPNLPLNLKEKFKQERQTKMPGESEQEHEEWHPQDEYKNVELQTQQQKISSGMKIFEDEESKNLNINI
jgi:hypothetical protein